MNHPNASHHHEARKREAIAFDPTPKSAWTPEFLAIPGKDEFHSD
jgi:hypothetical protein